MFAPGMFIFGVLIPLAVVALIAYGVWELARSRDDQVAPAVAGTGPVASAGARTILDERFARGEVDVDEYVRRRALLDGTVPSPPVDAAVVTTPPTAAPEAAVAGSPIEMPAGAAASPLAASPADATTAEVRAADPTAGSTPPPPAAT
jgi:hypothetical protein